MSVRPLTIVMYHYVRPLGRTRYPAIKGLDLELFREQVAYLGKHYTPVTVGDVVKSTRGGDLPPNPVLLTFDDGYLDHYQYVVPILVQARIQGAFFPPARAVLERKLLDVNKIHFVLAATPSARLLVDEVEQALRERAEDDLPAYRQKYWAASRFDSAEVVYLKNLLQHGLPEEVRRPLVSDLFARHVSADETAFAEELYASVDQLRLMVRSGMHVGSHGYEHDWLNTRSAEAQTRDIERSRELLSEIGVPREDFTFCYPYGAYNSDTTDILHKLGCRMAVTTKVELARLGADSMLELPRLDTNDLPRDGSAAPNTWTLRAMGRAQ